MTEDKMRGALQTIFSFFLGLMVLAFIAVGVNTFYQSPADRYEPDRRKLERQMERYNVKGDINNLPAAERSDFERLQREQQALQDKIDALMKSWMRNTSIVLVLFATIVMMVSLIRSEQLRVISNGLLLGGLFTMLYGSGWVIFSGTSASRFAVVAFALLVTVGLGYLKFVRERMRPVPAVTAGTETAAAIPALSDIEARIAALETRTAAAAAALSAASGPPAGTESPKT